MSKDNDCGYKVATAQTFDIGMRKNDRNETMGKR